MLEKTRELYGFTHAWSQSDKFMFFGKTKNKVYYNCVFYN